MIQIDKGIPIPPRKAGGPNKGGGNPSSGLREALRAMNVGDSFLWPKKHWRSTVAPAAKILGVAITVRVDETNSEKVRVWRTA